MMGVKCLAPSRYLDFIQDYMYRVSSRDGVAARYAFSLTLDLLSIMLFPWASLSLVAMAMQPWSASALPTSDDAAPASQINTTAGFPYPPDLQELKAAIAEIATGVSAAGITNNVEYAAAASDVPAPEVSAPPGDLERRRRRRKTGDQLRNAAGYNTWGKRGLAYNQVDYTKYFGRAKFSQVAWMYNWYSSPCGWGTEWSCSQNPRLQFIPTLWSNSTALTSVWAANVAQAKAAGSKQLFSFNEPDLCYPGSACMTVSSAVSTYQKYMNPYAGQFQLGAPAVSNGGAPYGTTWLNQFLNNCTGCHIDFINLHWYSNIYAGSAYFISYMQQAYQATGSKYPIFVTEFALTTDVAYTEAQEIQFLEEVMTWMDQTDYIAGYSYFYTAPNILVNVNGTKKSAMGKKYNGYSGGDIVPGGLVY